MTHEEQDTHDLQLRGELEQAFEQYLQAAEGEKTEAKHRYLEKLRTFSDLVMTGRL